MVLCHLGGKGQGKITGMFRPASSKKKTTRTCVLVLILLEGLEESFGDIPSKVSDSLLHRP